MSPAPCVLMSEGSSLSARESLTALGLAGYHVEVVDPNPLALVAAGLLANPGLWSSFSSGAVDAYAATPRVVEFVRRSTA